LGASNWSGSIRSIISGSVMTSLASGERKSGKVLVVMDDRSSVCCFFCVGAKY
jgi:hypothetical protein